MLLRSSQIAEKLGIHKNSAILLAKEGSIPSIRLASGHFRFDEAEVMAHLKAVADARKAEEERKAQTAQADTAARILGRIKL